MVSTMKKALTLFLSSALILSLTACSNSNTASSVVSSENNTSSAADTTDNSSDAQTSADSTEDSSSDVSSDNAEDSASETNSAENNDSNGSKVLVVYYSASGNTKRVAEDIAAAANADTFEIVPTEIYTSDDLNWTNADSRVSREHDDESLRDVPLVSTTVENWDNYDTVFIGYPIWWAIAAWPVDNFVKANDFTGKTVIPFATSSTSGMGQSGTLLANMAGTGNWQEGQRFSSGASTSDVQAWVNGLGL